MNAQATTPSRPASQTAGTLTPSRRSYADLQHSIRDLFKEHCDDGEEGITLQVLPSLLQRFQEHRGITILTTDELDELESMARAPGMNELIVTADSLIPILSQLMASSPEIDEPPPLPSKDLAPPSPRSLTGSESPRSFVEELSGDGTLDIPSSSSFSFSSSEMSDPVKGAMLFPRSHSANSALGGTLASPPPTPTPLAHRRAHALSDPSKPEGFAQTMQPMHPTPTSAMAARQRSTPLERSQELARPRRMNRRRESAETGQRSADNSRTASEEPGSPPFAAASPTVSRPGRQHGHHDSDPFPKRRTRSRQTSFNDDEARSSAYHQHSISSPPLDATSFRSHPLSPPPIIEESNSMHSLFSQPSTNSLSSSDMSRPGSHFLREGFGTNAGLATFRPDSLASINMADVSGEQVQQVLRDAADLGRKLKESELAKTRMSEDHEAQVMDLQTRIEEISDELTSKKREEKEVRLKRDQHLSTIREHEKELQRLETSLMREKDLHADMKRRFEEQCDESEKLRNEIRAKEESLRTMEDEMQDLRSEQGKAQHELHFAEMRIKELEDEVAAAHAAEHDLRSQKAANLSLKEELNRLRLEIDAANTRQQAASSNGSSQHASVSRSLGRELERRLAAMNDDEPGSGSDTEGENDAMAALKRSTSSASSSGSFIEETVTRIRRRKNKAGERVEPDSKVALIVDVTDVGTQTVALAPTPLSSPPRATTSAHPDEGAPPPYTPANDTWHFLLERYVPPIGLRPLAKRSPLLYGIIETTAGFAFYSMSIYLIGVLTGVLVLPVRHHHTLGDTERLFALYNTMPDDRLWSMAAGGALWRQRLRYWITELVWAGVDRARRIPT